MRRAACARAISVPVAIAGKPHEEQEVADAAFGASQPKQRQRYPSVI
jgi:hypothetical protein